MVLPPEPPRRALLLLVAGATFMELFDGTVLPVAAPAIARDLRIDVSSVAVPAAAYLVAVAALIPASGWVADRWGGRATFSVAVAAFGLTSLGCAFASSLVTLTALRIVQGAAGALLVPVGRLAVLRSTAPADVVRAIAFLTWPALIAPLLAPVVGGLLTTYASWRWIFLVNVPLAVVGVACARLLPPQRFERRPFDLRGFALVAVALGAMAAAAALPTVRSAPAAVALVVVGPVVGGFAVRHLRRTPHPLVGLGPWRVRTFRVAGLGGSLFRTAVSAVPFLLPIMVEQRFGYGAARAGLLVTAIFVGNLAAKPVTTPLLRRLGHRRVLIVAVGGTAVSIAAIAALTPSTPVVFVVGLLVLGGGFRSVGFTAYITLTFADIVTDQRADANTIALTLQQFTSGLGICLGAVTLGLFGADGLRLAWLAIGTLLVPALVEVVALPSTTGAALEVHGRRRSRAPDAPTPP